MKRAFRKILPALLLLSCLAGALSACSSEPAEPGPDSSVPDSTAASEPLTPPDPSVNTLFALPFAPGETGLLRPLLTHDPVNDTVFALLFDGLFTVNAAGEAVPRLASSIRTEELTVTVELDPNAVFHDGSPVTSRDVVWSLETARTHEDSAYAARLANVTEIRAAGPSAVTLTLAGSEGSLAYMLDVPVVKYGTGVTGSAVGCGRYRMVESEHSTYLIANETWYGRPQDGAFPVNLILLTNVDNRDALIYSIVSGNANLIRIDPLSESLQRLAGNCDVYPVMSRRFLYLAFNTSYYAVTGSGAVRAALAAAVDKAALTAALPGVIWSDGLYPESVTGVPPGPAPALDMAAARSGLAEAGFRFVSGKWLDAEDKVLSVRLVCGKSAVKQAAAELVAADLTRLGVETRLIPTDDMAAVLKSGNFELALCETEVSPDFDFRYLLAYSGSQNFNNFSIAGLDALLDSFFSAGHRRSARTAAQINALVAGETPLIPLGYKQDVICVSRRFRIGNVSVSDSDPFCDLFNWIVY